MTVMKGTRNTRDLTGRMGRSSKVTRAVVACMKGMVGRDHESELGSDFSPFP